MATVIERTEQQIERGADRARYLASLIAELGNPSEWEYTGVVNDRGQQDGKCACGHPIRYEFCIEHPDGREAVVGSTCVEHFEQVNPTLFAALTNAVEELKTKLAADKKAAKEAQQDEEIARLKEEREKLAATLKARFVEEEKMRTRGWVSEDTYYGYCAARRQPKEYKRKCDYLRWYRESIETLKRYVG